MKLKNKYILRSVADKMVAIAIENSDEKTDGVITLNSTGAFIFGLVNEGLEKEEIISRFYGEYDLSREEAEQAVNAFIENLEKANLLA